MLRPWATVISSLCIISRLLFNSYQTRKVIKVLTGILPVVKGDNSFNPTVSAEYYLSAEIFTVVCDGFGILSLRLHLSQNLCGNNDCSSRKTCTLDFWIPWCFHPRFDLLSHDYFYILRLFLPMKLQMKHLMISMQIWWC